MQYMVDAWRACQRKVRELEQLVTIAMDAETARREGIDLAQVQDQLKAAKADADRALQLCLAEARRTRRLHRTLGLDSSRSSGTTTLPPSSDLPSD